VGGGGQKPEAINGSAALHTRDEWRLLRQTIADWTEDKAPQLGAAFAFLRRSPSLPRVVTLATRTPLKGGSGKTVPSTGLRDERGGDFS
jgi:hypothetical protein